MTTAERTARRKVQQWLWDTLQVTWKACGDNAAVNNTVYEKQHLWTPQTIKRAQQKNAYDSRWCVRASWCPPGKRRLTTASPARPSRCARSPRSASCQRSNERKRGGESERWSVRVAERLLSALIEDTRDAAAVERLSPTKQQATQTRLRPECNATVKVPR